MNAKELIEELKKMPANAKVRYIWDGLDRSSVDKVFLGMDSIVMLVDDEEYSFISRRGEPGI